MYKKVKLFHTAVTTGEQGLSSAKTQQACAKMEVKTFVFTAVVLGCFSLLKANREFGMIGEQCLRCLCEASTDCNEDVGCSSDGPNQYLCGPYAISYQYWKDADSPGANPSDPLDFEKCLNNKPCAEAAIKMYVNRWGRDCNGDGNLDCYDHALLHKAGPDSCNGTWVQKTDFYSQFKTCYAPFSYEYKPY